MPFSELVAIKENAKRMAEEDQSKPLTVCPYDDEPLQYNEKRGILFCPWGDFQVTQRQT